VSYRGKRKGNYGGNQKRSRFSNPFRKKNKNKVSDQYYPPADFGATSTPQTPMQPLPELWLKCPTTFTYNGFRARLSPDPIQLQTQALTIAQLAAAKRKLEIELVSGETTKLFKVLALEEVANPEAAVPLDPQVEPLRIELQALGYTLLPAETEDQEIS
jgi:hypothetical protein